MMSAPLMTTDLFRAQHEDVRQIVDAVGTILETGRLKADARRTQDVLMQATATLRSYIAIGDEGPYAQLARHEDPRVRALACAFQDEMAIIRMTFDAYMERWSFTALIAESELFREDTQQLFHLIAGRLRREAQQLFPLLDEVGW